MLTSFIPAVHTGGIRTKATTIRDLTSGSIFKTLLSFSWPLMIANLLQIIYNMVDMMIVGQYVGSAGLSAVSCGSDIVQLATVLCMGFTSAGQIIISQAVGKGDTKNLSRLVGIICCFFLMVATSITIIGILAIDALLEAINVPPEAVIQAREYGVCCLSGMIFVFGYNTISAILRGMGDSKRPLLFISISAVVNLVLDIVFVARFGWGPKGAALATVIGQAFSFGASILYLYRKQAAYALEMHVSLFRLEKEAVRTICRIGIPLAIQGAAVSLSKLFVHSFINAYGVAVSAISGVGTKICQCSQVICSSMATAGTTIIGQSFGAKNMERIKKTVYITLLISFLTNWALASFMIFMPQQVFALFTSDPEALKLAPTYAVIAVLVLNGSALRVPFSALVSGQGNAKLSLVIGILDGIVVRIGCSLLLGEVLGLGIVGFWLGDVIASHVPVAIGGIYFITGMWRKFMIPTQRMIREEAHSIA